jgi:apolipoprotein D and lipocalin family protein
LGGCAQSTRHIPAVKGFDVTRYIGTWYEIARLPHSFEKGLTHVTAEYALLPDGRISVLNKGYEPEKGEWKTARAKARLVQQGRGELRVTFFWPFSAAYRVIALDKDYEHAMVTSGTMKYFWVLSRTPEMDPKVLDDLLRRAKSYGFDLGRVIRVDQSPMK